MTSTTGPANTGAGQQRINLRQDEPYFIERLQAADVAHAQAQRIEVVRAAVAVGLSCGSIIATVAHSLTTAMALLGVAGSVAVWSLARVSAGRTSYATKIQECFDTELFGLPAATEFTPLPADEEIRKLSRRYKGVSKKEWYADVTDLPRPYAILLCQRENLQWDWQLRRAWASKIVVTSVTWLVVGLAIAVIVDWSTRELLLRWIAPSLPALTLGGDLARANRKIARDKQQMTLELDQKLSVLPAVGPGDELAHETGAALMRDCRSYQSRLFHLRDHAERIPGRLYNRRKDNDEDAARTATARLRARLLGLDATQA